MTEPSTLIPELKRLVAVADVQERTFAVGRGNYPNQIIDALALRGNWRQISEDDAVEQADFYWRPINFSYAGYRLIDKRIQKNPNFVFNHFEVINSICTKTQLIKSLRAYYDTNDAARKEGYCTFDSTPTTFIITRDTDEKDIHNFLQRFRELANGGSRYERVPFKHCQQNMWVVKPASLNQGRGIEVLKNTKEITDLIFSKKDTYWVI